MSNNILLWACSAAVFMIYDYWVDGENNAHKG